MTHHNSAISADSLAFLAGLAYEIGLHTEALVRLLSYANDDDYPLTNAQTWALLNPLRADLEAFGDHASAVHQATRLECAACKKQVPVQPLPDVKETCTGCKGTDTCFNPCQEAAEQAVTHHLQPDEMLSLLSVEEALNAIQRQIEAVSTLACAHQDYENISVLLDAPSLSLGIIMQRLKAVRTAECSAIQGAA